MTRDVWLGKHPYLRPIAEFHKAIQISLASVTFPAVSMPSWDDYVGDFQLGVPLLQSQNVAIDFRPFATPMVAVTERLLSTSLPGKLTEEVRDLYADLQNEADGFEHVIDALLAKSSLTLTHPGLFYHLGWCVLARYLSDLVTAFGLWRKEENWLRPYCPTCGALPAMAQLVSIDQGRIRLLCCGQCGTRWHYPRVGCPFCGIGDDRRMGHLALEGEAVLRIDYCEACGGYLKTYNAAGCEALFLADWSSLHLDIAARDSGFNRFANSLYQF